MIMAAVVLLSSTPILAQPRGSSNPGGSRAEMRIQTYYFDNFFYSTNPEEEDDATALGAELRAAFRPGARPLEIFGHLSGVRYDVERASDTFGARIGAAYDDEIHQWMVFLDQAENRPSFEVGDTFARADVTTLAGEYAFRFHDDWEAAGETAYQRQKYDVESDRENDYYALGGSIRYRGLGWRVTPEAGLLLSRREVRNDEQSYESLEPFVQVTYLPELPDNPLWLSLRYRHRTRSYTVDDRTSRNFGRDETRPSWTFVADYRTAANVSLWAYFSNESIDSSIPGGDFEVGVLLLGITIGF